MIESLWAFIRQHDPVPWLWPYILLLVATYLVGLGLVALARPVTAVAFLSGFAQTVRANVAEASARSLVGLALIGMAPTWHSRLALGAGVFLVVTALAMLVLPDVHRRMATRSVASVAWAIRPIGMASLAMGIGLFMLLADTAY